MRWLHNSSSAGSLRNSSSSSVEVAPLLYRCFPGRLEATGSKGTSDRLWVVSGLGGTAKPPRTGARGGSRGKRGPSVIELRRQPSHHGRTDSRLRRGLRSVSVETETQSHKGGVSHEQEYAISGHGSTRRNDYGNRRRKTAECPQLGTFPNRHEVVQQFTEKLVRPQVLRSCYELG